RRRPGLVRPPGDAHALPAPAVQLPRQGRPPRRVDPHSPQRHPSPEAAMTSNDPSRSALSDRVRSLRLQGRDAPASRAGWLPWIVSFVLLLTTTAFGYRAYRVGPVADGESVTREVRKDDRPASSASSSAGEPTTSVAATGEVVLQSKGYVIPVSLVQVSPKVGGQIKYINP